jgi:hypothetical protein
MHGTSFVFFSTSPPQMEGQWDVEIGDVIEEKTKT